MKRISILLMVAVLILGAILIVNTFKNQVTIVEVTDVDSTIQMVDTTLVSDSNFWHYQ